MPAKPLLLRLLTLGGFLNAVLPAAAGSRPAIELATGWRFSAGDDAARARPDFDDRAWSPIRVGVSWTNAGHPDLHGYAWYRVRFKVPAKWKSLPRVREADGLMLDLGPVDDVDETFVNGERIGATGVFPPDYRTAWWEPRGYLVPARLVAWGGTNVLAVRVYDGQGSAGITGNPVLRPVEDRDRVSAALVLDPANGFVPAGREITVTMRLGNSAKSPVKGVMECEWRTDDAAKPALLKKESRPVGIGAGGGTAETFAFKPGSAGVYPVRLRLALADGGSVEKSVMPVYDPDHVTRAPNLPRDFDRFWRARLADLAKVPPETSITPRPDLSTTSVSASLVEMRSYRGVRIRGWLTVPKSKGPFPGMLMVPGYGSEMQPATGVDYAVVLALNIRGHGNSKQDLDPGDGEYMYIGLGPDPADYVYAGAYMDCIRGVDVLCSQPSVDAGRIAVTGGSQGGGLTFAAAALDSRITACAADVPWLGDWPDYATTAPWSIEEFPKLLAKRHDLTMDSILRFLSYFDTMNLADRIKCPVLVSMGLRDDVCPPRIVLCTYNQIRALKEIRSYPDGDHGGGSEVHDAIRDAWLRRALSRKSS